MWSATCIFIYTDLEEVIHFHCYYISEEKNASWQSRLMCINFGISKINLTVINWAGCSHKTWAKYSKFSPVFKTCRIFFITMCSGDRRLGGRQSVALVIFPHVPTRLCVVCMVFQLLSTTTIWRCSLLHSMNESTRAQSRIVISSRLPN